MRSRACLLNNPPLTLKFLNETCVCVCVCAYVPVCIQVCVYMHVCMIVTTCTCRLTSNTIIEKTAIRKHTLLIGHVAQILQVDQENLTGKFSARVITCTKHYV